MKDYSLDLNIDIDMDLDLNIEMNYFNELKNKDEYNTDTVNKTEEYESKSHFNIGNIHHKDYNDGIISNNLSKNELNLENKKLLEEEKQLNSNEDKSFYELNLESMPDRNKIIEELYEDELTDSSKKSNGYYKEKSKSMNILGKLLKRSEK